MVTREYEANMDAENVGARQTYFTRFIFKLGEYAYSAMWQYLATSIYAL